MIRQWAAAILCLSALALSACAEESSIAPAPAETTSTSAETTVTTTETTVTVTQTAPPLADFTVAEGLTLEAVEDSIRDDRCTLRLTNTGGSTRSYQNEYRLIDAATGQPVRVINSLDEMQTKTMQIAPGETKEIQADWSERYGRLAGGDYEYELLLSLNEGTGERTVCRAPFTVVESVFTPTLTIVPGTVKPNGLTLQVQNSDDAGRSYGLAYRIYEQESGRLMVRITDTQAKISKNYHVKPGEMLTLELNWKDGFGSLLAGAYTLEIELLEDGSDAARTYRADFEIS
ncbi:MAG: hypothetical protein IJ060_11825 [Oscillospiraceae bacterium]|nr:hypothetical protein [Oscillospiraceae bacterium]